MESISLLWVFLGALLGALGGLATILAWLEIRPHHVKAWFGVRRNASEVQTVESPVRGKRKWVLAAALVLFALSIGISSYSFYVSKHQQPGLRTGFEITHWENFIPVDHRYGSGLRVTVASDSKRGPVQLFIVFDGDIDQFPTSARFSNGGPFSFESQELVKSHADVFNVKWRTPEWTPDDSVVFEFLSRYERHPKWVIPVSYNPNP